MSEKIERRKPNRLFYTVKLNSSFLAENKYNINRTFEQCIKESLIISLSDSQMLKTIRNITGQDKIVDRDLLEEWYDERDRLKNSKRINKEKRARIDELQNNIYNMMYIPDYITVVMDNKGEYERMYRKGFTFNGKLYKRGSCSASQARVSTVVFITDSIRDEVKKRLDCGRDLNHPLAPSKYNAYYGLYSSSIKEVTKPRFCVVPDCNMKLEHEVDFVIETGVAEDDIIEKRTVIGNENRFDGSGLITRHMAEIWGRDLGEDYTPCNFCLRYAFAKGMVNEFDILEWCDEYNDGNYIIKDVWGKDVDLREIDVILSEGQVKLWDSWESQEDYERCCKENGIVFGITKYSPKEDKKVLLTNYQYLQTLDMNDDDIVNVCKDTLDYIQGVNLGDGGNDEYYSLMFMMGEGITQDGVESMMKNSDDWWLKSCVIEHDLLKDKYSKEKIRDMLVRKVELACLGRLIVKGNYQCICPDPFAYMEWICYRDTSRVKGLLGAGESYDYFWTGIMGKKDGDYVDCMRSPLTHFSEHGIDKLRCTDEMKKWYGYCYSGYISNIHDEFTYVHAGSDFDYDIAASTDCNEFVNGKYPDQRVVTYAAKKPQKKLFDEDDLYIMDTFSFGTKIGQITNATSTCIAVMANFDKDSKEYKLLGDRVKMGCAAQSRQIDKTKIGQNVKGIPEIWNKWQKSEDGDTEEDARRKDFYNSILTDKKPYFFKYKYKALGKEINAYNNQYDEDARGEFRDDIGLIDVLEMVDSGNFVYPDGEKVDDKEIEEMKYFVQTYNKHYPVIDSDCVMNKICKYIERVDFDIKRRIRFPGDFDYKILMSRNDSGDIIGDKRLKAEDKIDVKVIMEETFKEWDAKSRANKTFDKIDIDNDEYENNKFDKYNEIKELKKKLNEKISDDGLLTDLLVDYFYNVRKGKSKAILWELVGYNLFKNIKGKKTKYSFPIKDDNGNMNFLYNKYAITEILIDKEEDKEDKEEDKEEREIYG